MQTGEEDEKTSGETTTNSGAHQPEKRSRAPRTKRNCVPSASWMFQETRLPFARTLRLLHGCGVQELRD
jgi:hypothetical protein